MVRRPISLPTEIYVTAALKVVTFEGTGRFSASSSGRRPSARFPSIFTTCRWVLLSRSFLFRRLAKQGFYPREVTNRLSVLSGMLQAADSAALKI